MKLLQFVKGLRAEWFWLAGQIRPACRRLPTPVLGSGFCTLTPHCTVLFSYRQMICQPYNLCGTINSPSASSPLILLYCLMMRSEINGFVYFWKATSFNENRSVSVVSVFTAVETVSLMVEANFFRLTWNLSWKMYLPPRVEMAWAASTRE